MLRSLAYTIFLAIKSRDRHSRVTYDEVLYKLRESLGYLSVALLLCYMIFLMALIDPGVR